MGNFEFLDNIAFVCTMGSYRGARIAGSLYTVASTYT